jgi:HK97 gp10 family phage protein
MAGLIGVSMTGLPATLRVLGLLAGDMQLKALKPGVTKGAKIILKTARDLAPNRFGGYKRSLGIRVKLYRKWHKVFAAIGPRYKHKVFVTHPSGRTEIESPTKIAHLLEFGTRTSSPRPHLRAALESDKGKAMEAIADAVRNFLKGKIRLN